jgi:1,4-alpha-glucan branching enzyme
MAKKSTSKAKKTEKKRVQFTLEAPLAKNVILSGDFIQWNEKSHPMTKKDNGQWEKAAILKPGRYEYKFLVDGVWQRDPKNDHTCYNGFGTQNSVMIVK